MVIYLGIAPQYLVSRDMPSRQFGAWVLRALVYSAPLGEKVIGDAPGGQERHFREPE